MLVELAETRTKCSVLVECIDACLTVKRLVHEDFSEILTGPDRFLDTLFNRGFKCQTTLITIKTDTVFDDRALVSAQELDVCDLTRQRSVRNCYAFVCESRCGTYRCTNRRSIIESPEIAQKGHNWPKIEINWHHFSPKLTLSYRVFRKSRQILVQIA